jgi:protein-L-isoaspartate(D-aspartate) O-methyltransferase
MHNSGVRLVTLTTDASKHDNSRFDVTREVARFNLSSETARFNMPREIARFNMIEQQIRTWEVLDPTILQLLNDVPREHFVPAEYQGLAFADTEIPIGSDVNAGQTMLSPKLEGRILQALAIKNTQTVLHIGTGSGYFTALLASLARNVISVDINADLSKQAAKNLAQNNTQNVTLEVADAALGRPGSEHYDVIVYTGSSPAEPAGVRQQLNIGGTLFIVLGEAPAMQATLIKRLSDKDFRQDVLFETCIPELANAPQLQQFEF